MKLLKLRDRFKPEWIALELAQGEAAAAATDAALAKINALPQVLQPLSAEDVIVRGVRFVNDRPFKDGRRRLRPRAIAQLVERAPGVKVMIDHAPGGIMGMSPHPLPVGALFEAQMERDAAGVTWGVARYYMLRGFQGRELDLAIAGGLVSEVSVGIFFRSLECSICGEPIPVWGGPACEHQPAAQYGGKTCLWEIDNIELFDELSLVYSGMVDGTQFLAARSGPSPAADDLDQLEAAMQPTNGWTRLFPTRATRRERFRRWFHGREAKDVQTVILSKERFETREEAVRWMKDHDDRFRHDKIDETEESWRFRQFDPDRCEPGSFRSKEIDDGVTITICSQKSEE